MEEPLPVLDSPPEAPQPPAMSLAARLLNVFAIPGEVFAGVRASPSSVGNWFLPALVLAMVGVVLALTNVPQAVFQRQIHEVTEQYAKVLDEQVKAGKIKQPDADHGIALARAITAPGLLKPLFSVGIPVAGVARVFWWALMLWLLGRWFLKVRFGYPKALEVAGLGLMINVLGTVVMLLLVVNLPKLFSARGLAFADSDLNPSRQSLLLVGTANVFSIWLLGVLSVGLAKLTGVPFLRAAWLVFAAWAIQIPLFFLGGGVLVIAVWAVERSLVLLGGGKLL